MFSRPLSPQVRDLLVVVLLQGSALACMWFCNTNFLFSSLLVFGLPALYLLVREPRYATKVVGASLVLGVLGGFTFAFVPELNHAWVYGSGIVFPSILGIVPLDEMVWSFVWCLCILSFYAHFLDRKKDARLVTKRGIVVLVLLSLTALLNVALFYFNPGALNLPYSYAVVSLLVTLVFLAVCVARPRMVIHTLPLALYFALVNGIYEYISLYKGHWTFSGEYLGLVSVAGVTLPLEELVFFILIFSCMLGTFYELFFDNQKN